VSHPLSPPYLPEGRAGVLRTGLRGVLCDLQTHWPATHYFCWLTRNVWFSWFHAINHAMPVSLIQTRLSYLETKQYKTKLTYSCSLLYYSENITRHFNWIVSAKKYLVFSCSVSLGALSSHEWTDNEKVIDLRGERIGTWCGVNQISFKSGIWKRLVLWWWVALGSNGRGDNHKQS
jgi:hypothetical protein